MTEGIFRFFVQSLHVLRLMSAWHCDCLVITFWAVIEGACDDLIGYWDCSGAQCQSFISLQTLPNICSSEDQGAYTFWERNLQLFFSYGDGQGRNELPLIVDMVEWGIGIMSSTSGRAGIGVVSDVGSGFTTPGSHMATGMGSSWCRSSGFSCHYVQYCCSGLVIGWWFRWLIGSN